MALYFQNLYSQTIFIAFLFHNPSCGGTPFEKMGWWGLNSGQIFNCRNVDLRSVNRFAAFYAAESSDPGGPNWSGSGNHWYLISNNLFSQCFDDNTNCNLERNFVVLDFNGFIDVNAVLGPGSGEMNFKGIAPPRRPPK
jgi:hypothetical protein